PSSRRATPGVLSHVPSPRQQANNSDLTSLPRPPEVVVRRVIRSGAGPGPGAGSGSWAAGFPAANSASVNQKIKGGLRPRVVHFGTEKSPYRDQKPPEAPHRR